MEVQWEKMFIEREKLKSGFEHASRSLCKPLLATNVGIIVEVIVLWRLTTMEVLVAATHDELEEAKISGVAREGMHEPASSETMNGSFLRLSLPYINRSS
ncbi:hypothetical protein DEO72_LG10g3816 [Vigna unguiculata]|uniref:Uncharacterized protein n=1 Tax=Vigna unguiculata TaxID=3917 RepID=A0A4D6NHU9_VIGUN|nr:hypothetical protein DEO72_LG10g3816 [Vigna unguiculata]